MKGSMYRASGSLGAGGSPRTGGDTSQTGRPLRCTTVKAPVINGDFGTGNSPGAGGNTRIGGNLGVCQRFGAVRRRVAGRSPGAKADSPRQPACIVLCNTSAACFMT